MRIPIAKEAWPFVTGALVLFGASGWACQGMGWEGLGRALYGVGLVGCGLMLFFFRDPGRVVAAGSADFVSGADGVVRAVEPIPENRFLNADTVRISVFLSLFDVHVNRSPLAGRIIDLQYTPGRRLFAFLNAASEQNEHNSILIDGSETRCLVRQIVGPVARRVVCWLRPGQSVGKGDRLGIMKFGSRLDVYFPALDVTVRVQKGDRVVAGKTIIASLKGDKNL